MLGSAVASGWTRNGISDRLLSIVPQVAPGLLVIAHLMTVIALLSFGARAGEYPLHAAGLTLYVTGVLLAAVGLTVQARRGHLMCSGPAALLLSAPAFASLVFVAALWMTPFLGGALYAPYDPGDPDVVSFFSLYFAVLFSVVSVLYDAFGYLIVACVAQIALYVGTHALPHRLLYPSAHILGVWPSTFAALLGVYGVSAVLLFLRSAVLGRRKPGLWPAATLTTLAGAIALRLILAWLPGNGAYLGYLRAGLYVPAHAWDWTRPAAQGITVAAMAAAVLSALISLVGRRVHFSAKPAPS